MYSEDEEGKRHSIVLPEGKGLIRGWKLVVESYENWVLPRDRV